MVARRLWLSLQQVIRSVLLILFPLAFITLFAWATAGSTYGTTSDPMRAAVWLWLGSHLTPFHITSNEITGYLSYLPLGAVVLPYITVRIGYKRVLQVIENKKISRTYFMILYLLIYLILAIVSSNSQVSADLIRGIGILLILLFAATTEVKFEDSVKLPGYLFLVMLGVAGLLFSASLAFNFSLAKNLTIVINPGILGGILLLFLQLLYLPNIIFATLSYILGSGFSLGSATQISPLIFNLQEIPAIPLLAALPTDRNIWFLAPTCMVAIFAWLNFNLILKLNIDDKSKRQLILRFFVISILGVSTLAFVSSGSLISSNMSPVGVNPLFIASVVLSQLVLVLLLIKLLPKLFKKKVKQG